LLKHFEDKDVLIHFDNTGKLPDACSTDMFFCRGTGEIMEINKKMRLIFTPSEVMKRVYTPCCKRHGGSSQLLQQMQSLAAEGIGALQASQVNCSNDRVLCLCTTMGATRGEYAMAVGCNVHHSCDCQVQLTLRSCDTLQAQHQTDTHDQALK